MEVAAVGLEHEALLGPEEVDLDVAPAGELDRRVARGGGRPSRPAAAAPSPPAGSSAVRSSPPAPRPPLVDQDCAGSGARAARVRSTPRPRRGPSIRFAAARSKQLRSVRVPTSPPGRPASAPGWCRGCRRRCRSRRALAPHPVGADSVDRAARVPRAITSTTLGARSSSPSSAAALRCETTAPSPQASTAAHIRPASPMRGVANRVDAAEHAVQPAGPDRARRSCRRSTRACAVGCARRRRAGVRPASRPDARDRCDFSSL